MRDLNELQIDARSPIKQRPDFSESMLHQLESRYQVQFPDAFIDLLRFSNGGRPALNVFYDADGNTGPVVSQFFHLDSEEGYSYPTAYSVIDSTEEFRKLLYEDSSGFFRDKATGELITNLLGGGHEDDSLEEVSFSATVIAFAIDGGGNIFFLDASDNKGQVYIFYYGGETIIPLAESFESFINALDEG